MNHFPTQTQICCLAPMTEQVRVQMIASERGICTVLGGAYGDGRIGGRFHEKWGHRVREICKRKPTNADRFLPGLQHEAGILFPACFGTDEDWQLINKLQNLYFYSYISLIVLQNRSNEIDASTYQNPAVGRCPFVPSEQIRGDRQRSIDLSTPISGSEHHSSIHDVPNSSHCK